MTLLINELGEPVTNHRNARLFYRSNKINYSSFQCENQRASVIYAEARHTHVKLVMTLYQLL